MSIFHFQFRRRAFTLIELLVVVGIIALLAAILFPVFARARENARRANCQSNLKQIAMGFEMYTQDFDRQYPPLPPSPPDGTQGWSFSLSNSYLKNDQIFQCPSESDRTFYTDYWMNAELLGLNDSELAQPANTALNSDGQASTVEYAIGVANSPPGCSLNVDCDWVAWEPTAAYTTRHLGGANYSFADGHVKFLRPDQITPSAAPNGSNFTFQIN